MQNSKYEAIISDMALQDLWDIEEYITVKLKNLDAAMNTINGINNKIDNITLAPLAYPLVKDVPLSKLGLRLTFYKNYNILYTVNDNFKNIFVLRILYDKRDWINILK